MARTRRWAIVGSGTRNARAISGVVSPTSVRNVERDLRVARQRGMTAREDQPQAIVFDATVLHSAVVTVAGITSGGRIGPGEHGHLLELGGTGRGAAEPVERAVARGGGEPGRRTVRDPVAGPRLERPRERVLRALLGEVPVAGHPDEGRDDATPIRAKGGDDGRLDLTGRGYISQIGLTSIVPVRAPGIFAAISIASSRSLAPTT